MFEGDANNWNATLDDMLARQLEMDERKHQLEADLKQLKGDIQAGRGDILAFLQESGVASDNSRPLATVGIQSGKMTVVCDMPEALPAKFTRTKTEPNKRAIGDALKLNEPVLGCRFEQGPDSLKLSWRKDNGK